MWLTPESLGRRQVAMLEQLGQAAELPAQVPSLTLECPRQQLLMLAVGSQEQLLRVGKPRQNWSMARPQEP